MVHYLLKGCVGQKFQITYLFAKKGFISENSALPDDDPLNSALSTLYSKLC